VNFILDADIRSFFDEMSKDWLIRFVEHRIGDKRIIRLIQKWLKAGILEDGIVAVSDKGTGQGAVISPLLANIYLHYVLDLWAERWRRREATGDMIIVRYADDIIVGFEHEADARRFLDAMRERLGEFALTLHPDKTRLIEFGRHAAANRERRGLGKPETFNFLGFTFICGKSRRGKFLLKRKTRRDRMRAKLQAIKQELRQRRHQPIPVQGKWLRQVVKGYFNYHAVPTNSRALAAFRFFVTELWQRSLRRRSQKDGTTCSRLRSWPKIGSRNRIPSIHGLKYASPLRTQGGSRMRESRTYGSVRGRSAMSVPTAIAGARNDDQVLRLFDNRIGFDELPSAQDWRNPCGMRPSGGHGRGSATRDPSSARSCRRPCPAGTFAAGMAWYSQPLCAPRDR